MTILALVLLASMLFYIPSNGGEGISLPFNLVFLSWCGVAFYWIREKSLRYQAQVPSTPFISNGAVLLTVPWLLYVKISPGVLVLFLALLFWRELKKCVITARQKRTILQFIFVSAILQSGIGLVQTFLPDWGLKLFEYDWLHNHGRPFGIFQQVNVFASFLATGIGCGYFLLLQNNAGEKWWRYLPGIGLQAFTLMLNQSRAGLMGAVLIFVVLTLLFWRLQTRHCIFAWITLTVAAAAGVWIVHHTTISVHGQSIALAREYAGSTHSRWGIFRATLHMILEKPVSGWGYGSFSAQYLRYLVEHPVLNSTRSEVVPHPHNELLFAWFQGGIVALAGMLTLFFGWLKMIVAGLSNGKLDAGYAVLVLPLVVHLNLEYPLYQSFYHLGLLVILLRLGMQEPQIHWAESKVKKTRFVSQAVSALFAALLLAYSGAGLATNAYLTAYERQGLKQFPESYPWYAATQKQRLTYDENIARLVDYNHTHNYEDLNRFMQWASLWIENNTDRHVLLSMISILRFRNDIQGAKKIEKLYSALHPLPQVRN